MGGVFAKGGHRDAAAWGSVDLESVVSAGADVLLLAQNKKVANRGSAVDLPLDRARGSFHLRTLLSEGGQ